ncbi:MAG TPA: hypothetical protein VNR90_08980, partial [Vicinamibacterales bacterium]|nr:hypothetical protein [Vicinamibacterales bacterium]
MQAILDGEAVEIDAGARHAGKVARKPGFGVRHRSGRAFAEDRGDVRRDGGIERARRFVERGLQRLGIERRQVAGGIGKGGGGRRVAVQRRDAGEPAQGVGQVGGGGQSLPENQTGSLSLAAALSRTAAGRPSAHSGASHAGRAAAPHDGPADVGGRASPGRGRRASSASTNPGRADRR